MEKNPDLVPQSNSLKHLFLSWRFWKPLLAVLAGGSAGFLYYHFVGCSSGTCAITSNPFSSIVLGSLIGLFIVNNPCSRGRC